MRVLYCGHREWALRLLQRLRGLDGYRFVHVRDPKDLTAQSVRRARVKIAIFADWSWTVPVDVLGAVECVGFHAAPLPDFRGGSPIQNQIVRGIKRTTLTAFQMTQDVDAGDILLEAPLSLEGSLPQILGRIELAEFRMIRRILNRDFVPRPQTGKGQFYRRRRPEESELQDLAMPLERLYDFIRMLADPYPNAFIRMDGKQIVFKDARFDGERITFRGEIVCKS
ncbi:MAG: formyltransferase family protein [Gemmatimonadaceae bacterium]